MQTEAETIVQIRQSVRGMMTCALNDDMPSCVRHAQDLAAKPGVAAQALLELGEILDLGATRPLPGDRQGRPQGLAGPVCPARRAGPGRGRRHRGGLTMDWYGRHRLKIALINVALSLVCLAYVLIVRR
jgi:hypothetical protein